MSIFRMISEQYRRRLAFIEARRELDRLTPHDLADIGITIWDLDAIAREQADKSLRHQRRLQRG